MSTGLSAHFVKRFGSETEVRVDELTLSETASVTVLFGPSGSGKTTILRCLGGLERPDEGRIQFGGQTWFDSQTNFFLPPRLRNIGYVPQDYALFPHMSVAANIEFGLGDLPKSQRSARVKEVCEWLGLADLARRLPNQLSGGQQQRVALARAVARRPKLLLLDEPLSALDAPTRSRLRSELRPLLTRLSIPTVLVTHDRMEALALGDNLAVLDGGRLVQHGPVAEVFGHPASLNVAQALAFETVMPGRVVSRANGLATVAAGDRILEAMESELPDSVTSVWVCIRAENVILAAGAQGASSARNHLAGIVKSITHEGPLNRIEVNCGLNLLALLTNQSCEEMRLTPGSPVTALIKAQNIHLIARA